MKKINLNEIALNTRRTWGIGQARHKGFQKQKRL